MGEREFSRTSVATYEEQRVTLFDKMTEGPTLEYGYSRKTRWMPTGLRITFGRYRHGRGEWSPWRLNSGRLVGHNIRADGSWGAEHHERIHGYGNDPGGEDVNARLAKMAAAVERYGVDQPEHLEG